jgi:NAD-dependent deacetylase
VLPPLCKCGKILRPDVVWFGEPLPQDVWSEAISYANSCDVMIIAGTSLLVSPANTLPLYAKQNSAVLVEINPENTGMSVDMDLAIRGTSSNIIPKFTEMISKLN